jgi:DNA-binding transcriptional regulator YhcF (GntR family)
MTVATTREAPEFVRRTYLGANEYHTNFRKMDCKTISRLTSDEASRACSQMCKVYLSLVNAPTECWEREGVLRFAGEERGGRWVTAWEQLVSLVGVASATARKALVWMHREGIVGYFAGKNGVGVRVFLNRAASSIGQRLSPGQKNLRLIRASTEAPRASAGDTPFSDSYADLEVLDIDLNPRAPKNGAEMNGEFKTLPIPPPPESSRARVITASAFSAEEIVNRLLRELVPSVESVAVRAAAREHERMREWLENKGLPKAARVAQREAYNILRQHGLITTEVRHARSDTTITGRSEHTLTRSRPLSAEVIRELAETCVAMLEVHGQAIDVTLAQLSAEACGVLLVEDAPRVRELAEAMAYAKG